MENNIEEMILESSNIIKNAVSLKVEIEKVVELIVKTIMNGNKIILFGNGGSAADAQHIAAELVGRFSLERQGFPAIALTTDSSILTAIGNDYAFEKIFSRQCESLACNGDLVIGISTSGNSKNVEGGLLTSKKIGCTTIGLLGNNGGRIKNIVDESIIVNSTKTYQIQEVHRVIYHIICSIVEQRLIENTK